MIEKLTKNQEEQIPVYIDKWVNMVTKKINKKKCFKIIHELYDDMNEEKPLLIFGKSPLQTSLLAVLFFMLVKDKSNHDHLHAQLHAQLSAQLSAQLDAQLYDQLSSQLYAQLYAQLSAQLDDQLRAKLRAQLSAQLDDQLSAQIHAQLSSQLYAQLDAQLSAQLRDQLSSQLYAQLYAQLYDQLSSQLDNQLRGQLRGQLRDQLSFQLYAQLRDQLSSQLYAQLSAKLRAKLRAQLSAQLDDQLSAQIRAKLRAKLDDQLDNQLRGQLRGQLRAQLKDINNDWYLSLWWMVWCGWYDYAKYIGVKFDEKIYKKFIDFNREIHFIIPYKNICFISEKPINVNWKNKMLHKENGPAVEYSDGYGLYSLNGVRMPKDIVMTPADEIDYMIVLKEANADVRREIIRKIGIDRCVSKLGAKSVEKQGDYELINFDCIDNRFRPYLKMRNPSINTWHIEGVHPDCDTIQKALNWRNGFDITDKFVQPEVLT